MIKELSCAGGIAAGAGVLMVVAMGAHVEAVMVVEEAVMVVEEGVFSG